MTHQQVTLWTSAADAFEQRHQLVEARRASLPTPCSEFDDAALIEHAIDTQISFGQILSSAAQDGSSWDTARSGMAAALLGVTDLGDDYVHPGLGELGHVQLLAVVAGRQR